jgi:hypothetical protein
MAIITDVKKLRPELLTISDAEFERRADEIEMARQERKRVADVAAKEQLAADANKHIDAILAGVKFLHDKGILPERVAGGFSRSDGMFTPSVALRNVTAESLAGIGKPRAPRKVVDPNAPKRKRRSRAEMAALKAGGV